MFKYFRSSLAAAAAILIMAASPVEASAAGPAEPVKGGFAWGADAGGTIDMSGSDMSSIDFTAYFGYKRSWIKFIGIGAEIDIMVDNSCRSFPVYVAFRTNFQTGASLLFWDFRGGISANYLPDDYSQTGPYVFNGLGFNLASGKKFASHLVLGYTFRGYSSFETRGGERIAMKDVHGASVRLGITF